MIVEDQFLGVSCTTNSKNLINLCCTARTKLKNKHKKKEINLINQKIFLI